MTNQERGNAGPNVYITSDPHFYHANIMKHCGRTAFMTDDDKERYILAKADATGTLMHQFRPSEESVQRMNVGLVANINKKVGRDDILWCLGDWSMIPKHKKYYDAYYNRCREVRDWIQCRKIYFIWGNHDDNDGVRLIADLFEKCYDQTQQRFGNCRVIFNHYPLISWNGQHNGSVESPNICLYGHVHNKEVSPKLLVYPGSWAGLDCGVDSNNYQVWALDETIRYLRPNLESLERLKRERREFDPFRGRVEHSGDVR